MKMTREDRVIVAKRIRKALGLMSIGSGVHVTNVVVGQNGGALVGVSLTPDDVRRLTGDLTD